MELVTRNYWWPGVTKDMEKYVGNYDMCQRIKNRIEIPVGKLKLSEILDKPQTHLMMDFITKYVILDNLLQTTKIASVPATSGNFVAITEETSAEELAQLFRDNTQKLHKLLESIVLDKGLQFAVEIIKELNSMLGTETKLLTLFHPQTNIQIECMNQELDNKVYLTTKVSPFIVNYGRELRMEINIRRKGKIQEKMKQQADRGRKEVEIQKVRIK